MSSRHIETSVEIDASPARVWSILTDFAAFPDWNPFIKSISGELQSGRRLSVEIAPSGQSSMRFRPTVLALHPERELRWLGRVVVAGLFDGEHYFLIEPMSSRRVRFVHGEKFSGLLVGLMKNSLDAAEAGFADMNVALKRRAEQPAVAGPNL